MRAIPWKTKNEGQLTFTKPIGHELVVEIDICCLNPKNAKDIDSLFLFCKEGWIKSVLGDYHSQKQALSRFFLGAMILTKPVLEVIRRELRRVSPDVKINIEEIKTVFTTEVIKREVMEGEKADEARKKISRATNKALRSKRDRQSLQPSAPIGEQTDDGDPPAQPA